MELGPWPKGMNNKDESFSLPKGTLRNAVNVDFDNSGKPRRRKGPVKVYSGHAKGSYNCDAGVYFIESGKIKSFDGSTSSSLFTGIIGNEYAWDYFNGVVYFSDGIVSKKIVDNVVMNWGMTPPAAPVLNAISGEYGAGVYLGALCFVDVNGVESGASSIAAITANANCGISFVIPSVTDSQVVYVRLYLSMPNGDVLYHVADVLPNNYSYSISSGRYDNGNILGNAFVSPAPAGRIIRHTKARMWVIDGSVAWHSEPYGFDHFKLSSNYIQFTDTVDLFEPVDGGIFIAYGNKTEFWAGDVEDGFTVVHKADYGAVYGTSRRVPNSDNVSWQSQRGLVVGMPNGLMENRVEGNVAVETALSGASIIREQDGIRQFIACLKTPTTSQLAAKSFIDAEVIRRG